jgi:hypothetical protein
MQHIRLVPPEAGLPALVIGHVNSKEGTAELRTFEHMDAICRDRFKQGAPLDIAQYEQLLQSAHGFLAACGHRVTFAPTPAEMSLRLAAAATGGVDGPAPSPRGGGWLAGALAALAVTTAIVVWTVLIHH